MATWLRIVLVYILSTGILQGMPARAADWPMWRYDASRRAASPDSLPEQLHLQWVRQLPASQRAWPETQENLQFDVAPEPVVMDGRIFVPSSSTDSLTAYDTATGRELWRFYTDSAVRFAAVAHQNRVYFVSDDGYLYCLDAERGTLQWKVNGGPAERWVIGNHRLVSSWPARGGPVLHDGRIYFAASIWPFMGIFIHAVDPQTGKILWTNSGDGTNYTLQPHNAASFATVAPQGHLAAAGNHLVVPGGRSTPAVYDTRTGELVHFKFDKRTGGHGVMVHGDNYYVGGQSYRLEDGTGLGEALPALIDGDTMVFSAGSDATIRATKVDGQLTKSTVVDRRGKETVVSKMTREELFHFSLGDDTPGTVYIKAGSRIYCGGSGQVAALDVGNASGKDDTVKAAWSATIEGDVWNMLAADDRLFVVTTDCRIYCFGKDRVELTQHALKTMPLPEPGDPWRRKAAEILRQPGADQGFCVALGIGSGQLIEALLGNSQLYVVAVDADFKTVEAFRRKMQSAGLYGSRVSAHVGDPARFALPPYLANLVVSEDPAGAGWDKDDGTLTNAFHALRPYGGMACLESSAAEHQRLLGRVQGANLARAEVKRAGGFTLLVRPGALPDTDDWTHQYANSAQTAMSAEQRVKAPLGILWFGGPTHDGILPRHGHGPSPQVAAGRLFIEGPDILRCVDVYTGRVLWQKTLGELGKYYDNTSHFAGAGEIGSNYVSLPEVVYAVYGRVILALDSATGETVKEFRLAAESLSDEPYWGYIGVNDNLLVATCWPVDIMAMKELPEMKASPTKLPGDLLSQSRYASGSRRLVVFDRHTGELLWKRDARINFRHNNIVIAAGKVFCIDSLTEEKRAALARRAISVEGRPTLYALDAQTGSVVWSTQENVFGTFLNYSAEYDTLVQAGSSYRDRAKDEVRSGITAYRGSDGKALWNHADLEYGGPCLLWRDKILTNGGGGFALDIKTGQPTGWKYTRAYGCNTAVGCDNLLTFRSGAAGFFDLANDSGIGNLGGFRSSCTNNLIPANGVLNAPDYTRTCTCSYQNQTSLALVHMPEAEFWTYGATVQQGQTGINFGAPGDRRAPNGTLWVDYPSVGGPSQEVAVKLEPKSPRVFRFHSSSVADGELKWVAASGIEGVDRVTIDVEKDRAYRVKLCFLEPQPIAAAQRVFDVALQGVTVLPDFDIVREAGGHRRAVVKQFPVTAPQGTIVIDLKSKAGAPTVLCGVELIATP